MIDENKELIKAAKELGLTDLVPQVYQDLLQPAVKELGAGLAIVAKTVNVALAPLEGIVWGYDQVKEWLAVKVTQIHAVRKTDKIVPPPLPIAGPLVTQLVYAKDEPELRELYASLLASAMDSDNTTAHPSFVTIIQQLTPDEAKILRYFSQRKPDVDMHIYVGTVRKGEAKPTLIKEFGTWCNDAGVVHHERIDFYLDNLIRLRILHLSARSGMKYKPYAHKDHIYDWDESANIELTSFAKLFLNACVEREGD